MQLWYTICDLIPVELLHWDFMKNALLAILIMCPLFGLVSTMIVTGKMSFFSDALGHSAFTGIAIGCICGIGNPTWVAVLFSVVFALLFSYVRSRSSHTADTLIGVFSSTAVALGIFIATFGGGSFTKYNTYLIGDILSDINTRRAKVLSMSEVEYQNQEIVVLVPEAEIQDYAISLKALTQGSGFFNREYEGYEEVPGHLQAKIIAENKLN